jgi:monoamine oxidase
MALSLFATLERRFGDPAAPARRRGRAPLLSEASAPGARPGPRVLVVGAGLGGLATAFELAHASYAVTVLEARDRLGGRVLSFGDLVKGKVVEAGGEIVGSNHPAWLAYAERFGLTFLDVNEDLRGDAPLVLGGRRLGAEEAFVLWEQMGLALGKLERDAARVDAERPWLSPRAEELDRRNLGEWVARQRVGALCRQGLTALLTSAMGVLPAAKSYLAHLALVKGGGLGRFWMESEAYRCVGGCQQLAVKLAEALGPGRVRLGAPVKAVKVGRRGARVTLADGSRHEADDVVLAIPPSTWGAIAFDPPLPAALRPQMGRSLKLLLAFARRFWRESGLSSDALTDGPVGLTWESTAGQPGAEGAACLTVFAAGPAADEVLAWPEEQRLGRYLDLVEQIYPGCRKHLLDARLVAWPADPWSRGAYSAPAPGEVTTAGPILHDGLGRLHFAGEHACPAFQGFMEGALQSGAAVAARLARRDGLAAEG